MSQTPFDLFCENYPAVADAYRAYKTQYNQAGGLDNATKQLIQVGVFAALGVEFGVRDHARFAVDAGASKEDVYQAILLTLGPAGTARALPALKAAVSALET